MTHTDQISITLKLLLSFLLVSINLVSAASAAEPSKAVPNLLGTWSGENKTYSDAKGYHNWKKTIVITEQKARVFKGEFTFADGTKHFFGVIYPDNTSFTWVAVDSKGYNHGRIQDAEHISACYVEAGPEATAGCAELTRQ